MVACQVVFDSSCGKRGGERSGGGRESTALFCEASLCMIVALLN